MHEKIKKAVDVAQRAQRNYDLSKTIPEKDLETLIYAAENSPSKQNETHFSLHVYTDKDIIQKVYNTTKKFALYNNKDMFDILDTKNSKDEKWVFDNKSVRNSQILANLLFVYVDHTGETRAMDHTLAQYNDNKSIIAYNQQKNFSIGVSCGQLTMTATLLGYKTGICAGFDKDMVTNIIKSDNPAQLLVGIGHDNIDLDRRLHAETLNKEVPEEFRNGEPGEKWRFPSFEKNIKVSLNGKEQ